MPYTRRRVRTGRKAYTRSYPGKGYVSRYMRPRTAPHKPSSRLGIKRRLQMKYPGQIFRLVGPLTVGQIIGGAAIESTAAQTAPGLAGNGINFLSSFWTSPRFALEIANRFGKIIVKGFSINRFIYE